MSIIESIKIAVNSILSNKMRSFLTMLGIVIGISSVIAIASIGEGGKSYIFGQFEKLGVNIIEVGVGGKDVNESDYFTLPDVNSVKQKIPEIKAASPVVTRRGIIKGERLSRDTLITGTTGDYSSIFNINMLYGRFINEKDVLVSKNIVIIDEALANRLFGYSDCTGKTIRIGGRLTQASAVVVGVMKSQTELIAGFAGDSIPTFAFVPITFLKKVLPDDFTINQIEIGLYNYEGADSVASDVVRLMERAHNTKNKYNAQNLLKQLDRINDILDMFTMIISAIAAISLLVGGIGVMNIMLASVSERTREIGIRMALGASERNILLQFLTEAVIISIIGGMIGLIFGFIGGIVVGAVLKLTITIKLWTIMLVIGITSVVGIFFGIYPAKKASKMDPIEALRYE